MVRRLLVALAVTTPAIARADIPPDPDSIAAHCTRPEQCPNGDTCPYAFSPGDQEESDKVGEDCRLGMTARGLESRCRSGGNYSGEELFCPPGETGTWSPPGQPRPPQKPEAKPEIAKLEPTRPEPAKPEPAKAEPTPPTPAKAGMCAQTNSGAPGLLALLLLLARRRRR